MSAETMLFLGKWAFLQDKLLVNLDTVSGLISIIEASEPVKPQADQRFNLYGDINALFWFQANNGKYITFDGQSYVAAEERTGVPSYFSFETVNALSVRLVDHGTEETGTNLYYLNVQGKTVTRIPRGGNPPETTLFKKIMITPGLAEIQRTQMLIEGDLSYVYLASADLRGVNFANANLFAANLSNALLQSAFMPGSGTNLTEADLSFAKMQDIFLPNATMINADLSYAQLQNAELSNANMHGAVLTGADLTKANLIRSIMTQTVLPGAKLINVCMDNVQFDEANLCNVDFTQASVKNMRLQGAVLIGAILPNLDLTTVGFDENTNLSTAQMQNVNLTNCVLKKINMTHADLMGAILDGVDLTGAEMSYINLTNAKLRNNVKLNGASLSNSMLKGADFTGAQLGAKEESFLLDTSLAVDLDSGIITQQIQNAFKAKGYPLSDSATLTVRSKGQNWVIVDNNAAYTITKGEKGLSVWTYLNSTDAAVLAGAYMPNANFTSANLYAVNMSGVNWYGQNASADNADMEEVNLTCANLSSMNFKQARMYGCNLDFAYLIESDLSGAILRSSINKKQASLVSANIQGANFTQAQLSNIVMTNAAVSQNEGPFFKLNSKFVDDLNNQNISQALRDEFVKHGYPLSANATVAVNTQGISWTIINNGEPIYKKYNIIKIGDSLVVEGSVIGVHLFDLPKNVASDMDTQNLSKEIRDIFIEHGYPLLKNASIDMVIIPGKKWHIVNQESDPTKIQNGYVEFNILQYEDSLHVYGSALMVVRVGDDQRLEQFRYFLADTQLTQDVLEASATCPNGQKLQMYLKSPNRLTWEQMMTANTPPRPPKCVPSPIRFC